MSLKAVRNGDYGQPYVVTILDIDTNAAADISAYSTSIQFLFTDPDGSTATKTGAFVTNGTDGKVTYTTVDGDINKNGTWQVAARVTGTSKRLTSLPESFEVT